MTIRQAPSSNGVTPQDIWNQLIALGASPMQAAGIMGNMQAESSLNPDGPAGDQGTSYGLFQQHGSYSYLVTGNPAVDMLAQIKTMIANGGMSSAVGSSPEEVASNFAHGYERCAACGYQDGSAELKVRSDNARAIYNAATSGDWAHISYDATAAGNPGAAGASGPGGAATGISGCFRGAGKNCMVSPPGTQWCFTYCEAKGVLGGVIMVGGGLLILAGVLILARGAIAGAASSAASRLGPAGAAAVAVASRTQSAAPEPASSPATAGLTAKRRAPGRAERNQDLERQGSEAYDAGYQRAFADLSARARELETPIE